jgi:hypothetical protein
VRFGVGRALRYERVGFTLIGSAETRFGPAVRMRRRLHA